MIFTRFGTPVNVHGGNIDLGTVVFSFRSELPPKTFVGLICELKADGGIVEILEEIKNTHEATCSH